VNTNQSLEVLIFISITISLKDSQEIIWMLILKEDVFTKILLGATI